MSGPSSLLAISAVAVALSLQISGGRYDPVALAVVGAGTVAAVAAAFWRKRGVTRAENPAAAQALLGAGSAAGLAIWMFAVPVPSADVRAFQGGFRWFVLLSLVALSAYLCIHLRASLIRARFLLLLICFAMMAMVAIRAGNAGGDRYAVLALMIAAAWLLGRAVPGNGGELAAALALFQPAALRVVEASAPLLPIVFFCFGLALFAVSRHPHSVLTGGALILLGAFAPILAVPLALSCRHRRGLWVAVVVVAAALSMFLDGNVGALWVSPQQNRDALSFAPLASAAGMPLGSVAGLLIGGGVLALTVRRKTELPLACAAAAAACAVQILFDAQSSFGSWWLAAAVLGSAAAAGRVPEPVAGRAREPAGLVSSGAGAG